MKTGRSMHATELMQKLVEYDISTTLLIEFYEEVAENEKFFNAVVEDIIDRQELEEREKSVEAIERFCRMLRTLEEHYSLHETRRGRKVSATARRERMINNASKFLTLLEKECNVKFPDLE